MRRPRVAASATMLVAVALVAGACSGIMSPSGSAAAPVSPSAVAASPSPAASPSAPPSRPPAPSSAPAPSPTATPAPSIAWPSPPPDAVIARVRGELGSYAWDGVFGDAPWILPRSGPRVAAGSAVAVAIAGNGTAVSWDAAWAPVRAGTAGTPAATASGAGAVSLVAPRQAGAWSLRLTARFGPGREATWFWRVTVVP